MFLPFIDFIFYRFGLATQLCFKPKLGGNSNLPIVMDQVRKNSMKQVILIQAVQIHYKHVCMYVT